MTDFKKLKKNIEGLENELDGKNLEIQILNNELTDVLTPSVALSEMSSIFLNMLMENSQFVVKNGMTAKAKESRDRLLRLMELTKELDGMATMNYNLKSTNRELHAYYQQLRVAYKESRQEIEKLKQQNDF